MKGFISDKPTRPLAPGRYLLDDDGRLQPLRYRAFVRAVAIVTVRAKALSAPPPSSEPEVEPDDLMGQFSSALARVSARRSGAVPAKAKIDGSRIAAALSRRPAPQPPIPKPQPNRQALSGEECAFCGIPGSKGCDHFLPFVRGVHG